MRIEILSAEQKKLLPLLEELGNKFYLVGGTAIALHIGHRRSIDFDMFNSDSFKNDIIKKKIEKFKFHIKPLVNRPGEYTLFINDVKFTAFRYDYDIKPIVKFGKIKMPDLLTLAAMKAFALGQRHKWKDYVDLYFILRDFYSLEKIMSKAKELFGEFVDERMFRLQLAYFDDIDYTEEVEYMKGYKVPKEKIKKFLIEASIK